MSNKKILAFMQNQWVKDPDRVRAIYAKYPDMRNQLIARFLFAGCLSGKRLQEALGQDLCKQIIWEEASKEIGGHASSCFNADLKHMAQVIANFNPIAVVCFGKIAQEAILKIDYKAINKKLDFTIINAPHPASRNNPMKDLTVLKQRLEIYRELINQ